MPVRQLYQTGLTTIKLVLETDVAYNLAVHQELMRMRYIAAITGTRCSELVVLQMTNNLICSSWRFQRLASGKIGARRIFSAN